MENLTINKAARFLGKTTKEEIEAFELEFLKETADKRWLTINDWLWGKLQSMVIHTSEPSHIYWLMAQFVSRFQGKSGLQYSRLAIESALREKMLNIENKGVDWVIKVIGKTKGCEHSCKMDAKQFPLSTENLNPAQLAIEGKCQRLNCQCHYVIVPKRNESGEIIFRTSDGRTITF